jgi:hypothetical protein
MCGERQAPPTPPSTNRGLPTFTGKSIFSCKDIVSQTTNTHFYLTFPLERGVLMLPDLINSGKPELGVGRKKLSARKVKGLIP